MFDVLVNPVAASLPASVTTMKRLKEFAQLIQHFRDQLDAQDAYQVADMILRESGVMTAAAMDKTQEGIDRKENLDELLTGIHDFVQQRTDEGIAFTPIQDFLSEVSLLTDQDEHLDDQTPRITLMTVHAAKGLEFTTVFIVGLEENLFPSQFCSTPTELEEERRLLYVAITRAMSKCHLSYARQRFRNGSVNFSSPSRFLKDIDRQYLVVREGSAVAVSKPVAIPHTDAPASPLPSSSQSAPTRLVPLSKTANKAAQPLSADTAGGWFPNDRVRHRVFGEGTILRIYRENDNDKIDIQFDQVGKKTLLLTFAKLERV